MPDSGERQCESMIPRKVIRLLAGGRTLSVSMATRASPTNTPPERSADPFRWIARTCLGFRVQGSGFRVQGSGFRVQGSWFQGSGFQGLGFRVQELGRRVEGAAEVNSPHLPQYPTQAELSICLYLSIYVLINLSICTYIYVHTIHMHI